MTVMDLRLMLHGDKSGSALDISMVTVHLSLVLREGTTEYFHYSCYPCSLYTEKEKGTPCFSSGHVILL